MADMPGWIFLSLDNDLDAIATALSQGASGILTMASKPEDVEGALVSMQQGGAGFLPMDLLRELTRRDGNLRGSRRAQEFRLTVRELEVLELISAGESNASIAKLLGISYHTVRSHMRSLAAKLGTHTRATMEDCGQELSPPSIIPSNQPKR